MGEALRPERPERPVEETRELTKDKPRELNRYGDSQFAEFLSRIGPYRTGDGPAPFYMLHSALPHIPWVYMPDGRTYASIRERNPAGLAGQEEWTDVPLVVNLGWQRHLLQTRFADRQVGKLIAKLKRQGLYDRALVVVTADHGASFKAGGNRRFVTRENAADVSMVPLFIKAPGQREGAIVDRPLQSIDVLPTIADALERRVPWPIEGRSATDVAAGRGSVTVSSFKNPQLEADPGKLARQRRATLRAQEALFGTGLDGGAGFGLGPYRDLVGRRVASVPAARRRGARAELRKQSADPSSRYLPAARVSGAIRGARPPARTVAIAVNGRVAGVAPAFPGRGIEFFSLIVDPRYFGGANQVRAYAVRGTPRRPRLEPL